MKHPKALVPLFCTEFWERYGFYIIQGLLAIYLTSVLSFTDKDAYALLGEYSALVYISPILGGYFADKILGFRYAILIGAILLFLGYALIATTTYTLLFLGLACVIMGNGFLKPNISSFLGKFYRKNDPRRDSGFTIFYIGINAGIIASTITTGFIREKFGWHFAFGTAALGMLVAIASFSYGFHLYKDKGLPIARDQIRNKISHFLSNRFIIVATIIVGIALAYLLLIYRGFGQIILYALGAILFISLIYTSSRYARNERNKQLALILLIFIAIIFWALFFQLYFSVTLFIERSVDREVLGVNIPTIAFLSLESIFILLVGPGLAILWRKLKEEKHDLPVGLKFSLAMFFIAIAMYLLTIAIRFPDIIGLINPLWLVIFYFFITLGELFLSPIGLSKVTELAPTKMTGFMMGVWFMVIGFGGAIAGSLAEMADIPRGAARSIDLSIYAHAFREYALIAAIAGVVVLLLTPLISRLIRS